MGTFTWPMRVARAGGQSSLEVDVLVGTGATYSMIPGRLLASVGITPTRQVFFKLADGSREQLSVGEMRATINGESGASPVIFGPDDAAPLIGAVTLEVFLLAVDPIEQRLAPTEGILF